MKTKLKVDIAALIALAHSTYKPDTYHIDFDQLPIAVQKQLTWAPTEVETSTYTCGTPSAFVRLNADSLDDNYTDVDFEISLGDCLPEHDDADTEDTDEQIAAYAEQLRECTELKDKTVYFTIN